MLCPACRSNIVETARYCPDCGKPIAPNLGFLGPGSLLPLDGLGHVTVLEPLGEGGMGVVYRAQLEYAPAGRLAGTPGHPVAVKVLRPELRGDERARRMFLREAVALERIAHPNIVHFIALFESESLLAIVMEFVQGESLLQWIQRAARARAHPAAPCLSFDRVWLVFSQLLGALAAVHALGILHRDVKAANVLVRADGTVKLTDFGIARLPESGGKNTGGMIAGTGAYMSPEHVCGEEIDPRADLYAAAIVFYEMLTGETPFDNGARDEAQVRLAQLDEAPPALSQRVHGIPPALDGVIAHALAKDRRHRYGTALELGEAVRDALGIASGSGWSAQREFVAIARTLSEQFSAVEPDLVKRAEELRAAIATRPGP